MKVFTCNGFSGHYPVGTAAVIIANTKHEAVKLLGEELARIGLGQYIDESYLDEIDLSTPKVNVLCNGDY